MISIAKQSQQFHANKNARDTTVLRAVAQFFIDFIIFHS